MKIIIVGGVAGGASAAARARRLSENAEIILLERGPDVSFANCGLPYHIGEVIRERGKLLVTTAERLRERFRLDVRPQHEALAIDRVRKTLMIRDLHSGQTYTESYDKIILAPGAAPFRPAIPGAQLPNVFTLRNLADMDRIKKIVDQGITHAMIVGGGFIGLEVAENLRHRSIQVTLVNLQEQLLAGFDPEMTTPLTATLRGHGVEVLFGQTVEALTPTPTGLRASLTSGQHRDVQLVLFGVGVRPENQLATDAALAVGPRGGIRVNEHLQTSDPDIYAVGDAIESTDVVTGERVQVPLAGPANRQGRLAADHIFGRPVRYRGSQGTAILGVFHQTAAITGASEKTLRQLRIPYRKIYIHPAHHAGYYPGAESMSLKLLFAPDTGKILGAQGVGGAGVDKRLDVLATALYAGLTVFALEELELCYAPQFGSAKDPINMAGFVAAGLLRGDHPQTDVDTLGQQENAFLLDVRTPTEFAHGHLPGAINIPIDELRTRLAELPNDRPIIAYCQVGQRGYLATRLLMQAGYHVQNLSGGYRTYRLFHPETP